MEIMKENTCYLCPYVLKVEHSKEPNIEYYSCNHPKWVNNTGEVRWVSYNLIEIKKGSRLIENPNYIPDFCPLRIMPDNITPDMPPIQ